MTRNPLVALALTTACVSVGHASLGAQTTWVHDNHLPSGNIVVAPAGVQTASWITRGTDHFDIFYQPQQEGSVGEIAREAERAYSRVSVDLKHELASKMPLILVQTDRDVPQDSRQAGELVRASGAPDGDHLVLSLSPIGGRATVLVHELTHQFAFDMIPQSSPVPEWVHEGLSDHEAGTWTSSELAQLRDAAADAIPTAGGRAALDRVWGHAVFDFVAAEYGTQGLRRYLVALRNSSSAADAALAALGITASDFTRAFQTYVRARLNDR